MEKLNFEGIGDMFVSPGAIKEWWRQTKEVFRLDPEVIKESTKTTVGRLHWVLGGTLIFNLLVTFIFYTPDPLYILFMTIILFPLAGILTAGVLTLKNTWMGSGRSKPQKEIIDSPPTSVGREGQ